MGDPTLLGWLTVFAYLVSAVLSAVCAWRADRIFSDGHVLLHRLIWGAFSLGLLFLGINKQLDLQTRFIGFVKNIAYAGGWYELGQVAQVLFLIGMIAVSLALFLFLGWHIRHAWRKYWILLLGVLFLLRFIVVRTAIFFGIPLPPLSQFTGGFRINWLLELLGASMIASAALINIYRGRPG